jgi:hypothetical protein
MFLVLVAHATVTVIIEMFALRFTSFLLLLQLPRVACDPSSAVYLVATHFDAHSKIITESSYTRPFANCVYLSSFITSLLWACTVIIYTFASGA